MEQTANSLLAIGASPVMTHALEEVEEMVAISNSLVLNMGTVSSPWIQAMKLALKTANLKKIPVVFDPVGVGSTSCRTRAAKSILEKGSVSVIRGNASEIVSLYSGKQETKGVDSRLNAIDHVTQAQELAKEKTCIVIMSGPTDVITDGKSVFFIPHGHPLMAVVTGMGCTSTALTGAFLSINPNVLAASIHAMAVMGIVGEISAKTACSPGSFKTAFLDNLYQLSLADLNSLRVETP
jgi:hydroxyethylthiazole kinase